jgi:superoxide dismutase, Cu-Zn family
MNLKPIFENPFKAIPVLLAFLAVSCNNSETTTTDAKSDTTTSASTQPSGDNNATAAEAVLSGTNADTSVSGTVRFTESDGKVKMVLDLTIPKMANKTVAVHIHEHGACGDMGKEAHGHWNPTNAKHGKWGSADFHRGDIGNVDLNGEGKGSLEMETDLWSVSGSDSTKNILNRAIIVHGGKDDFTTQPTGNAGSRIGCGVIQASH